MKKILALLPIIAALGLTGCNDEGEGGGDGAPATGGDHLELTEEQARAKVKELGDTQGYEIAFEVKETDSETSQFVLGAKEHFYWGSSDESKYMYHFENNIYQAYEYDSEAAKYKADGEPIDLSKHPEYKEVIDAISIGFSAYLYFGNAYAQGDGLTKQGTVNFAGRTATKYSYVWVAVQGSASYELIIDNETGITLKWAVSGQSNVSGEKGSASMEAKYFKTGSAVVVPAHE